jgi:hypothetical protein
MQEKMTARMRPGITTRPEMIWESGVRRQKKKGQRRRFGRKETETI